MKKISWGNLYVLRTITAMLLWAVAAMTCARAQNPPGSADELRLHHPVRLLMGETSAAALVQELSRQTGLRIDVAGYLADRKLIVNLSGLSARQALDAVAEMNDWDWRATGPGSYLVSRPTLRTPSSTNEIPRAMQAALPKDFRTFLHLPDLRSKTIFQFAGSGTGAHAEAVDRDRAALLDSLKPRMASVQEVPYSELTGPQKERLLFVLMLQGYDESEPILKNDAEVHCIDVSHADLELEHGEILMVKTYVTPDFPIGFGKNVVNRPTVMHPVKQP